MAIRDLTQDYINLRNSKLSKPFSSSKKQNLDDDREELNYVDTNGKLSEDPELGDSNQFEVQPQWVLVLKNVQENMSNIKNGLEVLKKLQQKHATFSLKKDFAQEERDVAVQTEEMKRLFIESKKLVETIDTSKEPTSQEEVMKRNMKISLVNELNDLSIQFRNEQQEYLKNMERYKANQRANKVQYEESYEDMEPEERQRLMELEQKLESDPGFTDEQIRQMIQNEESIMRRDRELREILKSIVELNELFKEFSSLVVEQGTLLDRIDYNIEAACSFVKEGNKNLISAEKYQKMSRMTLCLLLLIVFFLAIGLFVALKLFLKFGLSVNLPSLHIFQ